LIAITDDVMCKVAGIIGGEDAIKVIMVLKELGEATDDQMLTKTGLKLNDVRKILFRLYNYSIVQCDRSRDKDTGWFIFRWRLQPDQVEGFINNQKRRIIKILKSRLEYEENNDFYYCNTPGCNRVTFEDAVEIIFRCTVCGNPLQHYDNIALINVLKSKIEALEKETFQSTS
jgi:transcription initiation factor TFIIE subunit alpha